MKRIKTCQLSVSSIAAAYNLHGHIHGHGPVEVEKYHADTDDDETEDYLLLRYQNTGHQDGKAELNCLSN